MAEEEPEYLRHQMRDPSVFKATLLSAGRAVPTVGREMGAGEGGRGGGGGLKEAGREKGSIVT